MEKPALRLLSRVAATNYNQCLTVQVSNNDVMLACKQFPAGYDELTKTAKTERAEINGGGWLLD